MRRFLRQLFGAAAPGPGGLEGLEGPEGPESPEAAEATVQGVAFRPHALDRVFAISGPAEDQSVLEELRHSHEFEPHVIGLLAALIAPDAFVLDVGANVGVLTVVCAELARRGRVFAFEASSEACAHLRRTLQLNDIANAELVERAVYGESGYRLPMVTTSAFLAGSYLGPASGAGDKARHEAGRETVATVSLDDWVAERALSRVDFIKMDIEGSELFAVKGARHVLDRFAPDLLVECNAVVMRRLHRRSYRELFALLADHYPRVYAVPNTRRDGTLVLLRDADELGVLLELGRGNEDVFCSRKTSLPVPTLAFDDWHRMVSQSMGGQQIVIEPDFALDASLDHLEGLAGEPMRLPVRLRNHGPQVLSSEAPYPTHASYHVVTPSGEVVVFDGVRTRLPSRLEPGAEIELDLHVQLPDEPGRFIAQLTLVQEGIAWLDQLHVPATCIPLVVASPGRPGAQP